MVTRVMILAGGTGGHIFPALAVADLLRDQGCDVQWMGTKAGMEARLIPQEGIPIHWLTVAGFRGKGLFKQLLAPFKLLFAFAQAGKILWRFKPDVVLGMGGFVAGPGGIMARLLGIIEFGVRIYGRVIKKIEIHVRVVLAQRYFWPEIGALCSPKNIWWLRRKTVDK